MAYSYDVRGENPRLNKIFGRKKEIPQELLYSFFAMGITLLGDSSLYVLLPIYAQEIGIPIGLVGILLSINRFIRLGTNQLVRNLYIKIGGKNLFLISIILSSMTTFLYGLPVGFVVFMIARAVWGGCWSSMRFVNFVKIGEYSNDHTRGKLTGIFNSIVRLGSLAATLMGGVCAELIGYRNTYYLFALLTISICLPLVILSSRKYGSDKQEPEKDIEKIQENRDKDEKEYRDNTDKGVELWSVYSFAFLNDWITNGLLTTTIGYILMIRFGTSINMLGFSIGVALVTSILASLRWLFYILLPILFGTISDKYGRFILLFVFSIIQALSLIAIAYAKTFVVISLAVVLAFAAATGLANILDILAIGHQLAKKDKNILGYFMTYGDLGSAIGAAGGYSLAISFGYTNIYLASGILLLGMLGIAKKIRISNDKHGVQENESG